MPTEEDLCYFVALPDGRQPCWHTMAGLNNMALAYALTVHKSQGSQYDSVLMPVTDAFGNMLYRNLFYTAISRAKKEVVLYGSRNAVGLALAGPSFVYSNRICSFSPSSKVKFASGKYCNIMLVLFHYFT